MSYYLEIWLRGFAKKVLREASKSDPENYHPHITFVRPFKIKTTEEEVRRKIINFCRGRKPIPFVLEGRGIFPEGISYIPVLGCSELLQFDHDLEKLLEREVEFVQKLGDEKVLHATVDFKDPEYSCPRIEENMTRLTAIRNKKIWFSYDFAEQRALTRGEVLAR